MIAIRATILVMSEELQYLELLKKIINNGEEKK